MPDRSTSTRRRAVAFAGHDRDEPTVRRGLVDAEPAVRSTALGALDRLGHLEPIVVTNALADPSGAVRRRACELAPKAGSAVMAALADRLADGDDRVVEAACFGLGELGAAVAQSASVAALCRVAATHRDPLCRESAVAALGAIGDPAGLGAILSAIDDKPAVRRRAVLALAPFEGPEVDAALARALTDRDWQVRQAAEDLQDHVLQEAPTSTDL